MHVKLWVPNYIWIDKTGTLTRNKMHVVTLYNSGNKVNINDIDHEHTDNPLNIFADKYYQK